jgi:hypothetical protein
MKVTLYTIREPNGRYAVWNPATDIKTGKFWSWADAKKEIKRLVSLNPSLLEELKG